MKEKSSTSEPPQGRRATMAGTKTLGPVPNLEEHVEPDWWRRIFNSIYLKTDRDVVDDQDITRKEVDLFFRILRLSPKIKFWIYAVDKGGIALNWQGGDSKVLRVWIAHTI